MRSHIQHRATLVPGQEPIACSVNVLLARVVVAVANMPQFGQVATAVVLVVLDKVEQLVGVNRCSAGEGDLRLGVLPRSFTACRAGELVETVVGEGADGVDPLVAAESYRLSLVLDLRHVAHRVIGVVQILQGIGRHRSAE
ncbi:hypothetical protein D3C81_1291450 [compost metagenome]